MKVITNNQTNSILFIKSNEDLSDVTSAILRQLGSDVETTIPISVNTEDCFTALLDLSLTDNQLANATYLLKVVDSIGELIFTKTVRIDGNDDVNRAYIILDE